MEGGVQADNPGEVEGSGWRRVSRPTPRGEVEGSGGGCLGPRPGGKLRILAGGVSRPTPRGDVEGLAGGGCIGPDPGGGRGVCCHGYCWRQYASYWNPFLYIM